MVKKLADSIAPSSPESSHIRAQGDVPVGDVEMQDAQGMNPTDSVSDAVQPPSPTADVQNSPEPRAPSETRYTYRQLARIALVAANGQRLTISQILLWAASTFPYLRPGQGSWEKSLRSALSNFPEFTSNRIAGAQRNKVLYGFASTDFRTQYEKEFSDYSMPSGSLATSVRDQSEVSKDIKTIKKAAPMGDDGASHSRKARKSAPSQLKSASTVYRPRSSVDAEHPRVRAKVQQAGSDGQDYMPFERPKSRQPPRALDFGLGVERTKSFFDTLKDCQPPCVETMTETEKALKIAEIKARPSRKKYFGSDHRLAHRRRYALEDIHDERDGAWKPPVRATDENQPDVDPNIGLHSEDENEDEDNRTLRQVFALPDNMIPMNDGQTELAFRDGTKVRVDKTARIDSD
jgi:hypothetical protein